MYNLTVVMIEKSTTGTGMDVLCRPVEACFHYHAAGLKGATSASNAAAKMAALQHVGLWVVDPQWRSVVSRPVFRDYLAAIDTRYRLNASSTTTASRSDAPR